MPGHSHNPNAGTQNQGNSLGDRSSVRQSRLYRVHESGNNIKAVLGAGHLSWDTEQTQGAYSGKKVYDHLKDDPLGVNSSHAMSNDSGHGRTRHREPAGGTGNFYTGYSDGADTDYRRGPIAGKAEPRRQAYEQDDRGYGQDYRRSNNYGQDYRDNSATDYPGRRSTLDLSDGTEYQPRRTNNSDYGSEYTRDSYGRGGAQAQVRDDSRNRGRRGSFNDENSYRNQAPYAVESGGKDDRGYRSLRQQLDDSSSGYQRRQAPAESNGAEVQRSAIRTYNQERDTRPW